MADTKADTLEFIDFALTGEPTIKTFIYGATDDGIKRHLIRKTGQYEVYESTRFEEFTYIPTNYICFNQTKKFLLAVCQPKEEAKSGVLRVYGMDWVDEGIPTLISEVETGGKNPCHLCLDSSENNIIVAQDGSVVVFDFQFGVIGHQKCFYHYKDCPDWREKFRPIHVAFMDRSNGSSGDYFPIDKENLLQNESSVLFIVDSGYQRMTTHAFFKTRGVISDDTITTWNFPEPGPPLMLFNAPYIVYCGSRNITEPKIHLSRYCVNKSTKYHVPAKIGIISQICMDEDILFAVEMTQNEVFVYRNVFGGDARALWFNLSTNPVVKKPETQKIRCLRYFDNLLYVAMDRKVLVFTIFENDELDVTYKRRIEMSGLKNMVMHQTSHSNC